jgi:hypothetical protein
MLFTFGFWVGAAGGGAVVWFFKDQILKIVLGAESFAASVQAKADALKAAVTPPTPKV